jgi:signal transduction histidine kinase
MDPVNLLVVDDRESNRQALAAMLEGYRIVEAASGPEALRRLLAEDFAVILLDVMMPGMSGFELAGIIKQRERTAATPILFLTGQAGDVELVYKGYRAGAVDYLVKPLVPEMVRAKVAVFAELHRQKLRLAEQAARLVEAAKRERDLEVLELRLASERNFQRLADAMPQIVWVGKPEGGMEYLNRRWFEYTSLRSRALVEAIHPDDLAGWKASLEGDGEVSVRLRAGDGTYRWHLSRAVREDRSGWIGTFTDIEEQKRVEHEKEHAVRARDEFLSVASHELRTPLSSLQLQIEFLLSEQTFDGEQLRKRLEATSRQVHRLARLITELLEVSRITTGRLTLQREEVDLAALTREVVARLESDALRAGATIAVIAEDAVIGSWDRFRLDQVITNLLTNAFKFGEKGPIEIDVATDGRCGRLTVRDHGIGISAGDVERIFQRFEQAVSGRTYGGLGLGLFIVRQITDAHGGVVRVASERGEGSTFTIELPIRGDN